MQSIFPWLLLCVQPKFKPSEAKSSRCSSLMPLPLALERNIDQIAASKPVSQPNSAIRIEKAQENEHIPLYRDLKNSYQAPMRPITQDYFSTIEHKAYDLPHPHPGFRLQDQTGHTQHRVVHIPVSQSAHGQISPIHQPPLERKLFHDPPPHSNSRLGEKSYDKSDLVLMYLFLQLCRYTQSFRLIELSWFYADCTCRAATWNHHNYKITLGLPTYELRPIMRLPHYRRRKIGKLKNLEEILRITWRHTPHLQK